MACCDKRKVVCGREAKLHMMVTQMVVFLALKAHIKTVAISAQDMR